MKESPAVSQGDPIGLYSIYVLALSVFALAILVALTLVPLTPNTREVLEYTDTAVCVLFLLDFAVTFWQAERKLLYLTRWGWIDLLSSIPAVDVLRWGRAARALRILRSLGAFEQPGSWSTSPFDAVLRAPSWPHHSSRSFCSRFPA